MTAQFSRASASAIAAISVVADRAARIGHQRRVQRALDLAGFRRRRELGPRQIGLQEFVGDAPARRPRRDRADDGRRRARNPSSSGLSCARASRDRPAPPAARPRPRPRGTRTRAAAWRPSRGCRVRNASRISPSSTLRCTAISVSCGWSQSEAAKAISSSAAARAAARSGAPKCVDAAAAPAASTAPARSSSLASTICTSVDQPSDVDAEEAGAERRARLALQARRDRRSQNTNAPDTAHSPGSAARSNTNVSDGSSRMVRSSFTRAALRSRDRARTACASAGDELAPLGSALPTRRTSRSPFSSMSRLHALLGASAARR